MAMTTLTYTKMKEFQDIPFYIGNILFYVKLLFEHRGELATIIYFSLDHE